MPSNCDFVVRADTSAPGFAFVPARAWCRTHDGPAAICRQVDDALRDALDDAGLTMTLPAAPAPVRPQDRPPLSFLRRQWGDGRGAWAGAAWTLAAFASALAAAAILFAGLL